VQDNSFEFFIDDKKIGRVSSAVHNKEGYVGLRYRGKVTVEHIKIVPK
jgi:hypothetical protein